MQRSFGSNLHQVAIAFFIFRQHQQMVVGVAVGWSAFDVVIVLLADIELAADDGLDPDFMGGIDKMHGAKDIAVIGHSNRGHAQLFGALAEFVHVAGAVEHGIVSVQMKMDELRHGGFYVILLWGHSNGKASAMRDRVIHRSGHFDCTVTESTNLPPFIAYSLHLLGVPIWRVS